MFVGLGKVFHVRPVKGEVREDESFWGELVLSQIVWGKCVRIRMKTPVGKGPNDIGRIWNM